ncbi:unnamed protein product [Leptidea sinapis]|uniref:Uncharacterized protein n=1 Tax=Leptidea sinapis TaxID=189913 RepID=A0A5E4PQ06_9NEOP|nr:unnamed protein product [Leptidea sinapis]
MCLRHQTRRRIPTRR